MKFESPFCQRRPAELHVPEEHHPVRAPVLDRVREHVGVHERAPGLAGAELPELAPGVAQPERRLPGVDARAEQLELEDRLDLAGARRDEALHAEPALAHAGEVVAVLAELVREGRQLGRPHHVEPVRVALLRLVAHVEHRRSRRCPSAAWPRASRRCPARALLRVPASASEPARGPATRRPLPLVRPARPRAATPRAARRPPAVVRPCAFSSHDSLLVTWGWPFPTPAPCSRAASNSRS